MKRKSCNEIINVADTHNDFIMQDPFPSSRLDDGESSRAFDGGKEIQCCRRKILIIFDTQ
jgi:hypothetical protein